MIRGEYYLECPFCGHANQVYLDFSRGRTGARCDACHKWFDVHVDLKPVDPGQYQGEASPLWKAAKMLLEWVPELVRPSYYAKNVVARRPHMSDRQKEAYVESAKMADGAPFLTESFLYNCLGKEDARTLLSLVRQMLEVGGIEMAELARVVDCDKVGGINAMELEKHE